MKVALPLLIGVVFLFVAGLPRGAWADTPVPERAWVRPAEVRIYQSLLGRGPKAVRNALPNDAVELRPHEALVVPVTRGDQLRVESENELWVGLGSGYGEIPDVVSWHGEGKQHDIRVPTFSAARFLVVKSLGKPMAPLNVWVAAGLDDPLGWFRADQQVRTWLSEEDAEPPELPAALAAARPILRWLVAARQALLRSGPAGARERWLHARWLEETFQMRPLYRPYFGPRRFRISGGSLATGQQKLSRPGTQIEERELRGGDELRIEGSDIDIVSLVVSAAADRDTTFDVYSGSELTTRSRITVPARGRRAGWLGARLVRVVPPVGGRVTVRLTAGRALVTVRAYTQLGGVLDRGSAHDRRALLASHEPIAGDVAQALLNADRDHTRATRLALDRCLTDLPASEPAARALLVHEAMRHDRGGAPPLAQLQTLWRLTHGLAPAVELPLRRSALAQLDAVTTRAWDASLPRLDAVAPAKASGLATERRAIAALLAILAPERDGLGPTESLDAEHWAASSHLPHAVDWAAKAWRREGPYKLLLPVAAPVREKLVQVAPEGDESDCSARGPRGQRWLALETSRELSVKFLGGTHTRIEFLGAPGAKDADALIAMDDRRFSVHAGARLPSVLAVTPGTHRFRQLQGNALLARFASDARYPCSSLLEVERWAVVNRQVAFELPSGHGWTELALTVDPESFHAPAELTLRLNGRVQRATFSGAASGTAQFWVEPAARRMVIESNQPLLVRARVRQRRTGRPTPEASPPEPVRHTQAEWLALLRDATRRLRSAEGGDARDRFRAQRAEALEALGYGRWASVERTRRTKGTGQTAAPTPYGAFRLAAGAPAIVSRGPLPDVPPLARPTPDVWFARLLDAEQSGEESASLLAVLQSRSIGSGNVDALLLAELAEREGQLATAAESWLSIWNEHRAPAALVEAARLTTDRAAQALDLAATFDAYALALQAHEAGGDVGALLGRMGNSVRWLSIGAERMSGRRWVEQRRVTSPDEPLSAQVRSALTDAPEDAVLLGAEPAGFGTPSLGSTSVQVEALCHALAGERENCSIDLQVDGQRLACRPVDGVARKDLERRRLDPSVARPIRCQLELPESAQRLTVKLAAEGRAAVGWAVARGVLPEGLGPSKFASRWVEGDPERPVEAWLVGPTVVRLTARSADPSADVLAVDLQHEDPKVPPIRREVALSPDLDPNARALRPEQALTREVRHEIVVPRAGRYRLALAPSRGRVLVKLQMSEVVAPPRARSVSSAASDTKIWRLLEGRAPRLSPVGVDAAPGPLTIGTWLALRSRDVTEGDQELAEGYAELGFGVRRALVDDLVWSAVQLFDRERVGPSSQGGLAGVWLTSRGGFPGAYARGELATQVLVGERALGALGVFGVLYPWTLRHDLKLVPVAQLVVRRADPVGKGQDNVDPQVYSNYAATRPHSVDWIARLDHRPYVDTLLGAALRVRMAPKFEGVDRVDLSTNAQVLAGSGWAPWLSLETLASYRPVSPQRRYAFTRFVATPAVTFWTWVDASQRLSLAGLLSYFIDVPREAGRESELSGQIQLSYDYTFLRGLNDFPLTDRPFRARLEEGLPSRRRAAPRTHPYWGDTE